MGNNHDYNIDNHSILSFYGGNHGRSSNTSSGTNNPTLENDS
jgi:hypothetical protein